MAVLVVVLKPAVLVLGVELTEARAGCAHDGGERKVGLALASAALLTLRAGLWLDCDPGQVGAQSEGGVALAVLVVVLKPALLVLGVELTEARAGCAHAGGGGRLVSPRLRQWVGVYPACLRAGLAG